MLGSKENFLNSEEVLKLRGNDLTDGKSLQNGQSVKNKLSKM